MVRLRVLLCISLILFFITIIWESNCSSKSDPTMVREPVRAGTFYPSDPSELKQMVLGYLNNVPKRSFDGTIVGAIVPHAGYIFSGPVAAHTYKQLQGSKIETVVIIGSCHNAYRVGLKGISVFPAGFYKTPLGLVEINKGLAEQVLNEGGPYSFMWAAHQDEHSIEVQLPFLQTVLDSFTIVPILLGTDQGLAETLAATLTRIVNPDKTLVLISTDMTHYPSYNQATKIDHQTLEIIKTLDSQALLNHEHASIRKGINDVHCTLCALQPVMALMNYVRNKGATHVEVLKYANSGDSTVGDKDRVVGYSAVIFLSNGTEKTQPAPSPDPNSREMRNQAGLDAEVQSHLLKLARTTLERIVSGGDKPKASQKQNPYTEKRGVFVTLKKNGELRGCIGHIFPQASLEQAVLDNTVNAAVEDPRFSPVQASELDSIRIEISVLTVPYQIKALSEFELGRHGIVLKKGWHQAVFLPQVAPEQGWDKTTTLSHLSRKAGLSQNDWQEGAEFYIFEAQVFHEDE
ncbi:AmmeMemoRadiSam system protein B [bacterium]|nr:AmmeMemoRadiSam system protein B [bacterium]